LPFKLNQGRRRHIPKQTHKVTNSLGALLRSWRAYDASLRQRGSLTVCCQQQTPCACPRARLGKGQVRLGQVVAGAQLLLGQPGAWSWVGGAVDGRHGMSGKGCAMAAGWGM
jgi:hypothetical protein